MKNAFKAGISRILLLVMLFSLLPMAVSAEEIVPNDHLTQWAAQFLPQLKNTETEGEETELPILPILIVTSDQKYAAAALGENEECGYLPATVINAQGTPGLNQANIFRFVIVDAVTVMIIDCYGRYVYMIDGYDGVYVSAQMPESGHLWEITTKQGAQGKYLTNTATGKTLGYDSESGCFGVYAEEARWSDVFLFFVTNDPIPGDLNDDEAVDNKDVEYLLWHTLFPDDYPLNQEADFSGDGVLDNKDVEYLLWYTLFPDDYPLA